MTPINRQLLREFEQLKPETGFLVESRDENGGRLFLRGPMQRAEAANQNKRIYPRALLQREFANFSKMVKEGRATGELDHPDTSVVSLSNISHVVREMTWENNVWMGRIEILTDMPSGKIAETLIASGIPLGISSRGVGSTQTNESGLDIVQDDFTLVTFDLVQEPSTHGAFMTLGESRRLIEGKLTKADRINRVLNELKGRK